MTDQEKIEAFLKTRGVTRVAEGAQTLGLTNRDWHFKVREPRKSQDDLIAERHTVTDHMGRVRVRNGLGEWIG